jgi:hypothetical protein
MALPSSSNSAHLSHGKFVPTAIRQSCTRVWASPQFAPRNGPPAVVPHSRDACTAANCSNSFVASPTTCAVPFEMCWPSADNWADRPLGRAEIGVELRRWDCHKLVHNWCCPELNYSNIHLGILPGQPGCLSSGQCQLQSPGARCVNWVCKCPPPMVVHEGRCGKTRIYNFKYLFLVQVFRCPRGHSIRDGICTPPIPLESERFWRR